MKALLLAGLLLPAAANAGYVGIQLGEASIDADTTGATRVDDAHTSIKFFGGARLTDTVAAEVGFTSFGTYSAYYPAYDEVDEAEASALYGAVAFTPELTSGVRLIAKLGFAAWSAEVSADSRALGVSGSGSGGGLDPMFGIGLSFDVTDRLSIRAEAERYTNVLDGVTVDVYDDFGNRAGSVETKGSDIDVLGLAAEYRF